MLIEFGSSAICMNFTHGTKCYDFNLTSIVVVDEYGEGIPMSNRQDTFVTMEFLKLIWDRTGNINPRLFMTDDAEQFFTAWRASFGDGTTTKLLCLWHVDRSWRKALQEHIVDKVKQVEVYHQLRILLNETEEAKFRVILQEFLTHVQEHHGKLYTYFLHY